MDLGNFQHHEVVANLNYREIQNYIANAAGKGGINIPRV